MKFVGIKDINCMTFISFITINSFITQMTFDLDFMKKKIGYVGPTSMQLYSINNVQ
jgi:hypothetical protein